VNRRLDEAVAAGRAKSSETWKVGNVSERAKVRRCTAVEDLEYQDGSLGSDALRNTQPIKYAVSLSRGSENNESNATLDITIINSISNELSLVATFKH